jgi:hypothetical protein
VSDGITEYITPGVVIDGQRVPIEGWMFVLAFALRGVEWAVRDALDPAFDMDGKVRDYERRRQTYFAERALAEAENNVVRLRARLEELQRQGSRT